MRTTSSQRPAYCECRTTSGQDRRTKDQAIASRREFSTVLASCVAHYKGSAARSGERTSKHTGGGEPNDGTNHWAGRQQASKALLARTIARRHAGDCILRRRGRSDYDTAFFELEGNTLDNPAGGLDDWQNLYAGGGSPSPNGTVCTAVTLTNCFDTFALTADKIGKEGDVSYFTGGGSKDRENISSWSWGTNDQAPDKNDITNAFAAAYRDNNSLVLALGRTGTAVNGDAQMGFWFNQAPMCLSGPGGTCPATTPNQPNTPGKFVDPETGALAVHTIGDILAIVNFDNGGNIGTANVYRWNGTEPVQVLTTAGQDCKNITFPTNFCTTSNTGTFAGEPPWPYNAKGGGADDDYEASAFIEGFIDLGFISGAGDLLPELPGRDPVLVRAGHGYLPRRDAQGLRAEGPPALRLEPPDDAEGRCRSKHPGRWAVDHNSRIDHGQGRGRGHRHGHHDVERHGQVLALRTAECRHGNV